MNHIYRNLLWWWPKQEAHGPHRSPEIIVQIIKHMIISYSWLKKRKENYENWLVLHLKDALCQVWLKLAQCWFFLFCQCIFLFRNYLPLEKGRALYLNNLNPLLPRMLCAKFGGNWPNGSGEEDFLILSMYLRYFVIIPSWKKEGSFNWTSLSSLHQGCFVPSLDVIGSVVLKKKIFKFPQCIFTIS